MLCAGFKDEQRPVILEARIVVRVHDHVAGRQFPHTKAIFPLGAGIVVMLRDRVAGGLPKCIHHLGDVIY